MSGFGPTITSIHNQWVKIARALHRRKVRNEQRAFLIEGTRLVGDALDAGASPTLLFYDAEADEPTLTALASAAAAREARVVPVSPTVMRAISDTETPQGIAAVVPFPDLPIRIPETEAPFFVIADAIRDPGNLGTLLRAALGAGVHAVYLAPDTVDPYSPKVVRAGMGAHFRLPIRGLTWHAPDERLIQCSLRVAATGSAELTYDQIDWREPACVIIGNEAAGLSPAARDFSTMQARIPIAGGLESLNAAIAGAVILFEAARQRRAQDLRS